MSVLLLSTVTVGILHALAPDHWLPFVMLGRAQQWTHTRTTTIVALAGLGHVASSLLIASIGVLLGAALEQVNVWESDRGNIASLLLVGFGLAYMVWGIKNWGKHHSHSHDKTKIVSYWTIFALLIFGPCEPLIPLIFVGYAHGWAAMAAVFGIFAASTILMMLLQVHLALAGISFLQWHWLEHGSHAIAGGIIALTGIAVRVFGI